ncbi:MAG: hypothetical protein ACK4QW_13040 [Alphaproteobacteria bacterium]
MTRAGVLGAFLFLAACGGTDRGPATAAAPEAALPDPDLQWSTAYNDGVIRVTLEDPAGYYRVDRVDLVDPAGARRPAAEITRETFVSSDPYYGGRVRPSVGVGGGYSSRGGFGTGVGIGISVPLGGGSRTTEPPPVRTVALLPVGDAARYHRTSALWELEATLLTPQGDARYARLPAPAPAPVWAQGDVPAPAARPEVRR